MYTYDAFVDDFHDLLTRNPNECVMLGVNKRLDDLPDRSAAETQADIKATRELLERLGTIERTGLDFDRSLDLDLAELALSARLHDATYTFNGRTMREQMPVAGEDISAGIFAMFVNDPRPAGERLTNITARIEKIPTYLEEFLGILHTPVKRWVDIEAQKITELPGLLNNLQDWAEEVGWADSSRLTRAREQADAALGSYLARLQAMDTTTAFHVGEETAQRIIALRGIELSLADLHRIAREFLATTRQIIEDLRQRLVDKYDLAADTTAAALHRFLNQRYRVAVPEGDLDSILDRYQRERRKILAFIEDRELFPILQEQDMKILRTPAFMAPSIPAGAMNPPPPFRDGMRTSLVYLTLSEALLDEHTELGIPLMMIHEGIPGHHLQLATASVHVSPIRRHVNASEHAEGWTTMLEDYLLDLGYMGDLTDEARFCGKRDLSRIGARVAIDLYFMTGDRHYLDVGVDCDVSPADPFVAAGNLLAAVTGFVPARVESELNWYSQERGYPLCYLTGNHLVWQLKREVAAAQRGNLDELALDRKFHDLYLHSGNMPVSFLRRVFRHHGLIA